MVGLENSQDEANSVCSLVKRYKMRRDMVGLGNSQDEANSVCSLVKRY